MRFDVFSVWNFLASAIVFAGGGYLIFRANRAAYVKVLKETSDGWERAYKQKATEFDDLNKRKAAEFDEIRGRLERLQGQFDNQEKQHRDAIHQMRNQNQEIVNLNVKLQLELKDKETEVAQLSVRVMYLETQIAELKRKYGESIS